jgi:nitrous oxidase accessory protein NosD
MRARAPLLGVALCLLGGCGEEASGEPAGAGGGGNDAEAGDAPATGCLAGQIDAPDAGCVQVGPQGCVPEFLGPDGVCRPTTDACPAGQIPILDEGCVSVGIPDCAAEFVDGDGHCRPRDDACPAESYPVPARGCVPIDGDEGCGSPPWGPIADGPDTVWVDPGASGAEDGTQAAPARTLQRALELVPPGGRIALAAGDYDEPLKMRADLEVVGRCPSLVTLRGVQTAPQGWPVVVLFQSAHDSRLRRVTIRGNGTGVQVDNTRATLEDLRVTGTRGTAILAAMSQTELTLRRVLIDDILTEPDGSFGRGIDAELKASVSVEDSAVLRARELGVYASGGASVEVSGSLFAAMRPTPGGLSGMAVQAKQGSRVTLRRSALVDCHETGALATDAGTELTVEECVVAGTEPRDKDARAGYGARAQLGATLVIRSSALLDNTQIGVHAHDDLTGLVVERSLVAGTRALPDGRYGIGLFASAGATLEIRSSTIARNRFLGVAVDGSFGTERSRLELRGSLVQGTLPQQSDGEFGIGVMAADQAALTAVSSVVRDNRVAGVLLSSSEVDVSDCLIESVPTGSFTLQDPPETHHDIGDGIIAVRDSTASVTRTLVRDCVRAGLVFAAAGGSLAGTVALANRFGLVLQGEPQPTYDSTSLFVGNGESDVLVSGALPVPDAPQPVPE